MGGESLAEALAVVRRLNALGDAATVDYMGESTRDRVVALEATHEFVRLAGSIEAERLQCSLSLDLSHVGLRRR
jgi:proline dehydrogenase